MATVAVSAVERVSRPHGITGYGVCSHCLKEALRRLERGSKVALWYPYGQGRRAGLGDGVRELPLCLWGPGYSAL